MARTASTQASDPDREVEGLRTEVARLWRVAREADHRAANSLQIAASFLKLQQGRVASDEARAVLGEASGRVGAIARAHRHFQVHAVEDQVDLGRLLGDLAADLSEGLGIECRVDLASVAVPADMAMQLVVVVNELVMNARKHAFDGEDPGDAAVVVSGQRVDGQLLLDVADFGRGLPDGFDPARSRGLGMQVVRATVGQMGGELRAWTDGGAHFTVTVPLTL